MHKKLSAKHPDLTQLNLWLDVIETKNGSTPPYTHLLISELENAPEECWDELFEYINHAHEGARCKLRKPLGKSLHPLQHDTKADPAFGYPHKLNDTALQGFFGEILAGVIAEHYLGDEGTEWHVPVHLFRTHVVAFQQLEYMKQTDEWEKHIVGRTGDDGLAFVLDDQNQIIAWLACEAKCTRNHSAKLISDNHQKLSQNIHRPIDLTRMIEALEDYRQDSYAKNWIAAFVDMYWRIENGEQVDRYDFSMYVCGQPPKRNNFWIDPNTPHADYTGGRDLSSAEMHISQVNEVIQQVYSRMESGE